MTRPSRSWLDLPAHLHWLDDEGDRLLAFAERSRRDDGGFAWLDESGKALLDRPVETWITARMTHVFSLASLRDVPSAGPYADHGLSALRGLLHDDAHGGWYAAVHPHDGAVDDGKAAYVHAFVVLAAASATAAGRAGAPELLADALDVVDRRFWSEAERRCLESWDATWTSTEAYRGANSNMHGVEAFLAAADVTGDVRWRHRALDIASYIVHEVARANSWRLVEHFDEQWRPDLDHNRERPDDPFRPYGATIGHWLEWSRLLLHLDAALDDPPAWLVEDASALFAAAVEQGWAVDGRPGFVYTVGWDGAPLVPTRMHWVAAEGVLAAAALHRRTGDERYERLYRQWWEHVCEVFVDRSGGSWHHELDPDNRPSATVWRGKPDVYHAYQATLLPRLPLAPAAAAHLAVQRP